MENEKVTKLILKAESIKTGRGWSLASCDNPYLCSSCKSPLFYIRITWGVVDETDMHQYSILGRDHKYQYYLREIGFGLFCAECGTFEEDYWKYFYPEDKLVCTWRDDELDKEDMGEIHHCLAQWNKKGEFKPNYYSSAVKLLNDKLKEYESNKLKSKSKKIKKGKTKLK